MRRRRSRGPSLLAAAAMVLTAAGVAVAVLRASRTRTTGGRPISDLSGSGEHGSVAANAGTPAQAATGASGVRATSAPASR